MSISAAQRTRLGVFMVSAVVLIAVIFIAGIGLKISEKTAKYYTEFRGESLSGLGRGMEVKFRGIPIGKVSEISYDSKDLSKVSVEIEVEKDFPMKDDMIIQTGMTGITGLKYIEIMGGTNDAKLVEEGSMIESKPSMMASLTDKADDIITKINQFLDNVNILSNPDSLTDIKEILTNFNSMSKNLDGLLATAGPNFEGMSKNLNSTLEKVDLMVNNFYESNTIEQMMLDVDTTIVSIKTFTENFNRTFVQSKEDLSSTMEDLKETMENVNELSQTLLENPSLLLRGSPNAKRKIK